ncbi:hypothetical protein R3P38DRAFT_2664934 [Favolaschia claudopus]|uniref:F-box domain-containing protein n=1 Tax=Favolaschia claudopus TaxID=2862362 RepID=A0AAV9ZEV2_9AGAR
MALVDRTLNTVLKKVSHISRIPCEILAEIFRWTLWPGYTRVLRGREVAIPPWKLGHICRYWRETAQADPCLWSQVVIQCRNQDVSGLWRSMLKPYHPYCNPALDYPLEAIATQLRLSRSGPLSVELRLDGRDLEQHSQYMLTLLKSVVAESNRWVRLTIGDRGDSLGEVFNVLSQVYGRLDQLQYLCVEEGCVEWPKKLEYAFMVAPNLQEVYLPFSLKLSHRSPGPFIWWFQLTKLDITARTDFLLRSLRAAKNLRDLVFSDSTEDRDLDSSQITQGITLPQLQGLSLMYGARFVQYLSTPRLEHLDINFGSDHILPFIIRSGCDLHSLKVHSMELADLIAILKMSPNLFHLELAYQDRGQPDEDYGDIRMGVFSALILDGTTADICLKLGSLRFDSQYSGGDPLYGDTLCRMLHSRWRIPPHLRSLKSLDFAYQGVSNTDPIWEQLNALKRDGLDITGLNPGLESDAAELEVNLVRTQFNPAFRHSMLYAISP